MGTHVFDYALGDIHYLKRGWGEPLLLLHGLYPGASHEEFEHNVAELAIEFTVYAPDLLGFGLSDAPAMKYTAGTYTNLVLEFVRRVIAAPTHVMAAGMSCGYATDPAVWRDPWFRSLSLVCPRSEPVGLTEPRWLAAIQRLMLSNDIFGSGFYESISCPQAIAGFLAGCFANPRRITRRQIERMHEHASRIGSQHAYASLLTGFLDYSILPMLPKVNRPVMILWGRQAQPVPVQHSVRLAASLRYGRLDVIEDAGTWPHHEQSAAVNKLVIAHAQGRLPVGLQSVIA